MRPWTRGAALAATLTISLAGVWNEPAHAVTIQARVDWSLGGTTGSLSPDIAGPATSGSVDVLNSDSNLGNSIFYHTYGNTGGSFGSRVSGDQNFDITGEFNYSGVFVNPNPTASPASFTFVVIPGKLSGDFATAQTVGSGDEMFSRYEIDIRANGTTIAKSAAQVVVDAAGSRFIEDTDNTFGLSGAESVGNGLKSGSYTWAEVTQTVDLGSIAPGGSLLLEYDLRTLAHGIIAAPDSTCAGTSTDPGPGGRDGGLGGGPFDGGAAAFAFFGGGSCGGATARSGDPFDPALANTSSVAGLVAAPEPGALALALIGLLSVGALGRRRPRAA